MCGIGIPPSRVPEIKTPRLRTTSPKATAFSSPVPKPPRPYALGRKPRSVQMQTARTFKLILLLPPTPANSDVLEDSFQSNRQSPNQVCPDRCCLRGSGGSEGFSYGSGELVRCRSHSSDPRDSAVLPNNVQCNYAPELESAYKGRKPRARAKSKVGEGVGRPGPEHGCHRNEAQHWQGIGAPHPQRGVTTRQGEHPLFSICPVSS